MRIKLHNSVHPIVSIMAIGASLVMFFYIVIAAQRAYELEAHIVSTQQYVFTDLND